MSPKESSSEIHYSIRSFPMISCKQSTQYDSVPVEGRC